MFKDAGVDLRSILSPLFPHELKALIEALQRDMKAELALAIKDHEWADYHRMNARMSMRILETLQARATGKDV
ncbi:hypothetical protein [Noviherbaspirillum saxi]|nr:hypothetical protein [Noviherbaspirillum saxi]